MDLEMEQFNFIGLNYKLKNLNDSLIYRLEGEM